MNTNLAKVKFLEINIRDPDILWLGNKYFFLTDDIIDLLYNNKGDIFAIIEYKNKKIPLRKSPLKIIEHFSKTRKNFLYNEKMPFSAMLPFSYQKVDYRIRWFIASLLARMNYLKFKIRPVFPDWPLDLSADCIEDLDRFLNHSDRVKNKGVKTPVILTHDIDNPESLKKLNDFLNIEEKFDIPSTIFIVPKGWKLEDIILDEALAKGNELGVHGYNHDNKTPFLKDDLIRKRMEEILPFIKRYNIKGYRSPSLLRTENLFRILKEYFIYDSSIPNSGTMLSLQSNGCASARSFIINEGFKEVPITLPSDASLLFLGYSPSEILKMWIELSELISESGGIVVLLTHCEKRYSGNSAMLNIYEKYLTYLKNFEKYRFFTIYDYIDKYLNNQIF
ncbi:MAG: polysaccharide deacetylase family protein [Candidatus Hydrogenedentota bacterium]